MNLDSKDQIEVLEYHLSRVEMAVKDFSNQKERLVAKAKQFRRNKRDFEVVQALRQQIETLDIQLAEEELKMSELNYHLAIQKENI